jgi:RND family efflux transporter MFP subunit
VGNGSAKRGFTQVIAAVVTLALACAVAYYLVNTKPSFQRKPRERKAALVEVVTVASARRAVVVDTSGTVVPSRVVTLQPDVRGRVLSVGRDLEPGALLKKGAVIAQIDPSDYHIAVRRAKSGQARAEADFEIEQGHQEVARKEVELFNKDRPGALSGRALREPQLEGAKASVSDAKATLSKAHLDLSRTRLTSPFDAVVRSRDVSVGSRVSETTTLATVVGIETWWVEVTVPKDLLRWLRLPDRDASLQARIYDEAAWGKDVSREGRVLRVGSELVEGGRLVRVLIGVDDPKALKVEGDVPELLLGSWVKVAIEGREIEAIPLARELVHDGDRVWVIDKEDRLDIRKVTVAAKLRGEMLISAGLKAGERVVSSDLPWPVQGMRLSVASAKPKGERKTERGSDEGARAQ